ncbi:MAG: urate hydroxylase PuuD [Acidobacteria bacterium]|nr:urate hydroxylase PuuD [Acidobacteriota bacterium]
MMPDVNATVEMLLRWIHSLAGITWIGLLYFFNLVNVPLMKALDAPTKGKVIPELMPRALWWFRHGSWVTVLAGIIYYYLIVRAEPSHGKVLGLWMVLSVAAWGAIYALLRPSKGALNKGTILGVCVAIVALVLSWLIVRLNGGEGHTSRALSVGIGGGLGVIMMLNVWGIIWRNQKKIIAWTVENASKGTPIPAESGTLARQVFLASRTNFWLSIPMLFFMGAATHYPIFGG